MGTPPWKVGELAKRTGVSVRALHHYEQIGLLRPAARTEAGHRLYGPAEVARLHQIRSLAELGFSLAEIHACLERPEYSLPRVIDLHLARLRTQLERQQLLCRRLDAIARALRSTGNISVDAFFQSLEAMSAMEKHYTPEQREQLRRRAELLGEERIRAVEAEWPQLIAEVRAALECGTDPASPAAQELAERWHRLVQEFTGGDPGIEQALGRMYEQEASVRQMTGITPEMMEFIRRARAVAGC